MAYRDPSSTNVFVPSWEATGQVVGFIRSEEDFRLNRYVAWKPATKPVGLYLTLESEQAIRVPTDEEFAWADGEARPEGNNNLMGFDYKTYRTERRDIPFTLGNRMRAACPWDVVGLHATMAMSQEMTRITWRALAVLQATGNWGTHTGTAEAVSGVTGGFFDTSTTAQNVIQKALYNAYAAILADTNSVVQAKEVVVVISPDVARRMRTAPEITDYIKGSPFALAQVRGELPNPNVEFGLPATLFGFDLIVETAQRVSTRKKADGSFTRAYIKDNSVLMVAKRDALPGEYASDQKTGITNFSTFQIFYYVGESQGGRGEKAEKWVQEDGTETGGFPFVVETFEDTKNRRLDGHVVSDLGLTMVARESGYLITGVLSN